MKEAWLSKSSVNCFILHAEATTKYRKICGWRDSHEYRREISGVEEEICCGGGAVGKVRNDDGIKLTKLFYAHEFYAQVYYSEFCNAQVNESPKDHQGARVRFKHKRTSLFKQLLGHSTQTSLAVNAEYPEHKLPPVLYTSDKGTQFLFYNWRVCILVCISG